MNISLREITADTVRAVCKLVAEPAGYVAPNAISIAEAYFYPEAWFRAIYAGEEPIGFVMLEDSSQRRPAPAQAEVSLWRFMIDAKHKGKGYGRAALRLVIADVRRRHPGLATFATSCVPGPASPRPFYESLGFVCTGEIVDDEEVLVLRLDPPPTP
ncbi:GNAT family N-acetyltransferase [Rivibacter subsaxonicus]|uniref:Diamine N-acetyltransferase n=1 Tax=Rivibacter subsaxonicus TaxID=457575 RepID=A0A4Q7W1B7_9BURK|nr:GNAT family N-acetyltransferase [Rivibacter subsaxonicus]RZU02319.1 diamine N-acetyltransferase [Rivibacter subsaxonicus]